MLALTEPVFCYRQHSKHLELAKCIQATLQQQVQKQMIAISRWVVKSTQQAHRLQSTAHWGVLILTHQAILSCPPACA